MLVTGNFATQTTVNYNYYVCPSNWTEKGVTHIAVNHNKELKFLGKIIGNPIDWSFDKENKTFSFSKPIDSTILENLKLHKTILENGPHYLFKLDSLNKYQGLIYNGNGPLTRSHRYFNTIDDLLIHYGN